MAINNFINPASSVSALFCSFIHSDHFNSAPSSPLLLRGDPDTARILCWNCEFRTCPRYLRDGQTRSRTHDPSDERRRLYQCATHAPQLFYPASTYTRILFTDPVSTQLHVASSRPHNQPSQGSTSFLTYPQLIGTIFSKRYFKFHWQFNK